MKTLTNIALRFWVVLLLSPSLGAQVSKGPSMGNSNAARPVVPASITSHPVSSEFKVPSHQMAPDSIIDQLKKKQLPPSESPINNIDHSNVENLTTMQGTLYQSFEGMSALTPAPPDPNVAAGPQYVVAVVNSRLAIYSKEGVQQSIHNLSDWFSNVNPPTMPFDPRVMYDHYAGHFIILTASGLFSNVSSNLLSVSQTSDPNGLWWNYNLDATINGDVQDDVWADYPDIGFDWNSPHLMDSK